MRRGYTPACRLTLLLSPRRKAGVNLPGRTNSAETDTAHNRTHKRKRKRSESFQVQTFRHMDALFSDALCLTGSSEDAAALVVTAYDRAFQEYEWFRRRRVPGHLRTRSTRAWLYGNLHGAFCDGILRGMAQDVMPTGGQL